MFKKKKTINFDKEIKNVKKNGLPTIVKRMVVMAVIFFWNFWFCNI